MVIFIPFPVVDRKEGAFKAIKESWCITQGHALTVFTVVFVGFFMSIPLGRWISGAIFHMNISLINELYFLFLFTFILAPIVILIFIFLMMWMKITVSSLYHVASTSSQASDSASRELAY